MILVQFIPYLFISQTVHPSPPFTSQIMYYEKLLGLTDTRFKARTALILPKFSKNASLLQCHYFYGKIMSKSTNYLVTPSQEILLGLYTYRAY